MAGTTAAGKRRALLPPLHRRGGLGRGRSSRGNIKSAPPPNLPLRCRGRSALLPDFQRSDANSSSPRTPITQLPPIVIAPLVS